MRPYFLVEKMIQKKLPMQHFNHILVDLLSYGSYNVKKI